MSNTTKTKTSLSITKDTSDSVDIGLIMPLAPVKDYPPTQFEDVRDIIKSVVGSISDHNFAVSMVSDSEEVSIIQKTIVQNIYEYPLVIVDVSSKNPNVMFELGLRLAFDMPIILIKDDKTDYSFDTAPIKTITYRSDLRHPDILEFTSKLKQSIINTYKKSLEDKDYSPYLSSFGDIKVKEISESSVNTNEALTTILEKVTGLTERQRNLEDMFQNKYRHEAIDGLKDYYERLFDTDYQTWSNIDLTNTNSSDYKQWLKSSNEFITDNFPSSHVSRAKARELFNEIAENADPLPF